MSPKPGSFNASTPVSRVRTSQKRGKKKRFVQITSNHEIIDVAHESSIMHSFLSLVRSECG